MYLDRLSQSEHKSERLSLDLFFTIKRHKPDQPLRAIASDRGTWHVLVSDFLKRELHKLHVNDTFELRNSDAIIDDLQSGVLTCSVGVENLYYSLPQQDLLNFVKACIVKDNDEQKFQSESGVTVGGFNEVLTMYLRSTIVMFEGQVVLPRAGVCIVSCVPHVLSRIFLGRVEVCKKECLQDDACRIHRYVDDYLVFVCCEEPKFELHDILNVFDMCGMGLTFTF
ncbi:hypothetical protein HPB48_000067 [Haemaphysalis longicornis]|uniref:Reverse transcriptase domain-containing protein n=1 Tax=Haemaphysalis longicornis TaxID=44386 RepID=A0A9J6G9L5_HAELO|nr:hypothetical protein HPB48_000067 [Haemaphysalis longicornis]